MTTILTVVFFVTKVAEHFLTLCFLSLHSRFTGDEERRFQAQEDKLRKTQERRLKAQGSRLKKEERRLKAQARRKKNEGSRLKAQGSRLKAQGSRFKVQERRRQDLFRPSRSPSALGVFELDFLNSLSS
ncbi:uncharacterized protein BYT42DRAFT_188841 [Radiomyces spectabilis]|uniref:uncharacterized protein n=1 Tax=Radiomyces spectabilis TaxID=64574 RepID=UPI0022201B4D|nr:uncharacterized protein BYT42DRAFT_188841 [Radiomyces spectabilis]KAI8391290.1 hypothetical protein BYT42DRAFT_188841 [Radiomyces spectabilis]